MGSGVPFPRARWVAVFLAVFWRGLRSKPRSRSDPFGWKPRSGSDCFRRQRWSWPSRSRRADECPPPAPFVVSARRSERLCAQQGTEPSTGMSARARPRHRRPPARRTRVTPRVLGGRCCSRGLRHGTALRWTSLLRRRSHLRVRRARPVGTARVLGPGCSGARRLRAPKTATAPRPRKRPHLEPRTPWELGAASGHLQHQTQNPRTRRPRQLLGVRTRSPHRPARAPTGPGRTRCGRATPTETPATRSTPTPTAPALSPCCRRLARQIQAGTGLVCLSRSYCRGLTELLSRYMIDRSQVSPPPMIVRLTGP